MNKLKIIVFVTLFISTHTPCMSMEKERELYVSSVSYDLIYVPAGTVMFGCPIDEVYSVTDGHLYEEQKVDAFWMMKYEISNKQYLSYVASIDITNSIYKGMNISRWRKHIENIQMKCLDDPEYFEHPYEIYSFEEIRPFVDWLSANSNVTFDIPSSIQWEYAAEGKTILDEIKLFPWGDIYNYNKSDVNDMCLCNSGLDLGYDVYSETAPCGAMWSDISWCGIYDLAGNLGEPTTPTNNSGSIEVRGGSYIIGKIFKNSTFENFQLANGFFFTNSNYILKSKTNIGYGIGIRLVVNRFDSN
jgi:formylglycine-generating enzyme required for sulfatase activity